MTDNNRSWWRLYCSDAYNKLKELESKSVDNITTSPPYWQRRDNGVAGQLGLERDFRDYLEHLWLVFAEAKRVLKDSGTCYVILDDTTNGNKKGNTNGVRTSRGSGTVKQKEGLREFGSKGVDKRIQEGVKDHSLLKIPAQFCIGMIYKLGWINACEIVWYKTNGQPNEAGHKRYTYGYDEHVYYFIKDWDKVKISIHRIPKKSKPTKDKPAIDMPAHQVWEIQTEQSDHKHYSAFPLALADQCIQDGCPEGGIVLDMFMGSGTTGVSALRNNRNFIGIDISPEYVEIARKRLEFQQRGTLDFYYE